jgi:glycosyltransferase involved in cell wall biosynthesis
VFHSPYDLIPGGGERYLLTAASALTETHRVYVVTEARYSQFRLDFMARELALDLSGISILTWSELRYVEPVDVFVQLHNHQFPAVAACGKHNVFICQFPFPLDSSSAFCNTWSHLANYDRVVVYSKFARENLQRKLNVFRFDRKIDVLYPPVPITRALTKQNCPATSRLVILTIGRFFVGGHNKRHDVLIGALARLRQKGVDAELHIVGALHSEAHHVLHLHALGRMAEGLPAQFHVNATPALVNDLLSRATIYWHATGFDVDPRMEPEKCEHFGISIIEGMAAGCVPFVVANGGPLEFVRDGETGFHYSTIDELVAKTCALACDPLRFAAISQAAVREAALFSDRSFKVKWRTIALE